MGTSARLPMGRHGRYTPVRKMASTVTVNIYNVGETSESGAAEERLEPVVEERQWSFFSYWGRLIRKALCWLLVAIVAMSAGAYVYILFDVDGPDAPTGIVGKLDCFLTKRGIRVQWPAVYQEIEDEDGETTKVLLWDPASDSH